MVEFGARMAVLVRLQPVPQAVCPDGPSAPTDEGLLHADRLGQDRLHDVSMHVREPVITTLESKR